MAAQPNHSPNGATNNGQTLRQAFRELSEIRATLWPQPPMGTVSRHINRDDESRSAHTCLKALKPFRQQYQTLINSQPGLHRAVWELEGYAYQAQRKYRQAAEAFMSIPDGLLAGEMHLASGNIPAAVNCFAKSQQIPGGTEQRDTPWGSILLGLITGKLHALPSILQVRQHLEANIALLLSAGQSHFLNNLARYSDFIAQVNPEGYKLLGRGVLHGGAAHLAGQWLLAGQQQQPQDPETYYHLGQWYAATGEPNKARRALNQCLMMSPMHPPADALINALDSNP